jgi:tRNA 2-thiocytidine biosynthesis protein TtcA
LCGSQKNLQRQVVKDMMRQWDKKFPGRLETMFTALRNVQPSHLVDNVLHDFQGLKVGNKPVVGGDMAFDQVSFELRSEEVERLE